MDAGGDSFAVVQMTCVHWPLRDMKKCDIPARYFMFADWFIRKDLRCGDVCSRAMFAFDAADAADAADADADAAAYGGCRGAPH